MGHVQVAQGEEKQRALHAENLAEQPALLRHRSTAALERRRALACLAQRVCARLLLLPLLLLQPLLLFVAQRRLRPARTLRGLPEQRLVLRRHGLGAIPLLRLGLVRLVQPNAPQHEKWDPRKAPVFFNRQLSFTAAPNGARPDLIVWPETAVPFLLPNDTLARTRVTVAVPADGRLITGSVRSTYQNNERQLRNALVVLDDSADVAQVYDKSHLVPFGEYVPLRGVLPIDRVVPGQSDFVAGSGRRLLAIDGLPWVSPLICYEAIFSGRVTPPGERPGWMLNLTNDAWFGTFAGPQQHFAIASARAVEEGLPMVRVANTGISAVVDPYGRVVARLGIGERGILDSGLPMALPETIFARWGETIPVALAVFSLLFALMLGSRIKAP